MNIIDLSSKKVLIFSDTHLTCKFNEKKFQALKGAIGPADMVIINGDFWEYLACPFEKFLKSKWAEKLFPLLKEKNTIFLHGNHDHEKYMTWEGIQKFANDREKDIRFKSGNKIFKLEHGDLISLEFDEYHRFTTELMHKLFPTFYLYLISLEYKKHFVGRWWHKYMEHRRKRDTGFLREFSRQNKREGYIRIFGHVHTKKHNLEDNFLVLGEFMYGVKNYIYIENGEIEFVTGTY